MSLMHLFEPPSVPRPQNVQRITLIDVETSEEARERQRREALAKARAALPARARKPRAKRSHEEQLAARRAAYAAQRAAGIPPRKTGKPFSTWSEAERAAHRMKQHERYYANREAQLARAKARFAALTPEQRAERNAKAREWKRRKREQAAAANCGLPSTGAPE